MARQIGIPSKILRDLAESGKVPALRVGDAFLFDADATKAAICTAAQTSAVRDTLRFLATHPAQGITPRELGIHDPVEAALLLAQAAGFIRPDRSAGRPLADRAALISALADPVFAARRHQYSALFNGLYDLPPRVDGPSTAAARIKTHTNNLLHAGVVNSADSLLQFLRKETDAIIPALAIEREIVEAFGPPTWADDADPFEPGSIYPPEHFAGALKTLRDCHANLLGVNPFSPALAAIRDLVWRIGRISETERTTR